SHAQKEVLALVPPSREVTDHHPKRAEALLEPTNFPDRFLQEIFFRSKVGFKCDVARQIGWDHIFSPKIKGIEQLWNLQSVGMNKIVPVNLVVITRHEGGNPALIDRGW